MDESRSPAEINSIDCMSKKRKLQDELLELPLLKHVCWHQNPELVFSSNNAENDESFDQQSAKDSNSFHCDADSIMSTDYDDESKPDIRYPEVYETSTSSYCEIHFYSSKSVSLTKSNPSQTESFTLTEQIKFHNYQYGIDPPSLPYEEHLEEFGNLCVEESTDKQLENYVLSSGRWSVNNQGNEQESKKKLTIDKEFEEYFSMLMM
ncbi:hypothetical protein ACP275_12G171200 [Erythranthe tilingii]